MTPTTTDVAKDVVALLGEGQLVDCVPYVAGFEEVTRVLAGVSSVRKALYVGVKPVH